VPESAVPATDLDLISFLKSIPYVRMRRGIRIQAWYLLLVAVLGILSRCQSLRDLERFAIRHHSVLGEALGINSGVRPPILPSATSSAPAFLLTIKALRNRSFIVGTAHSELQPC